MLKHKTSSFLQMLNKVMSNHETSFCGGPSCFADIQKLGILVLEAGHLVFHTNVHLHAFASSKDYI